MRTARAGLYLATFMAVFDIAVVYLALPNIERSIGAGISDQQWIASAYGLMEAGFALAAGTLGDLYGRRRVYLVGIALFIAGSIGSGVAPTADVLIGCRFVQGIGGAIAMALPLAILVAMSNDPRETERSIRMYATIAGLGAVTAPALGGIMVQTLGWRSVFFVNVPLSLFVLYAALTKTPESPRDPAQRLDLGGQLTLALTLLAGSYAAIEGNALGWRAPAILAACATSIAAAAAFVWFERRAVTPMITFALLRQPLLSAGALSLLVMNVGFFTMYLVASLFLQNVKLLDPLAAGWFLLANNLAFFLTNQFGGGIARRFGERRAALAGMAIGAGGLALFAAFDQTTAVWIVALPLALTGFGWGLAFTPINTLAMSVVSKADTGLASGLLGIGRPLGAVIGTAVFGSVLSAQMRRALTGGIVQYHGSPAAASAIASALRHGGLWSLAGTAQQYGLPDGLFRVDLDAGFVIGMQISATICVALSLLVVLLLFRVYRERRSPVIAEPLATTAD